MKDTFPFNYFSTWIHPREMFTKRNSLSWPQMIVTLLFSLALVLVTVPVYYAQQKDVNMGMFLPKVNKLLQNKELQKTVHETEYQNGTFDLGKQTKILSDSKQGVIATNMPIKETKKYKVGVFLEKQELILREKNVSTTVRFVKDINPNTGDFHDKIQKTWYRINRVGVTFSVMYMVATIIIFTTMIFLLLGSLFLWMTRKSSFTNITKFKEAFNMLTYVVGPSCFITAVLGLFKFDISLMVMVETLVAVVYLLAIYSQTRFSDDYVEMKTFDNSDK